MKREVPELSIIITAHDEGLLAHKTMLSIFRALENVKVKYEIIVHIDRGTSDTIKYFQRYAKDKRFKIIRNSFGDSGKSRNAAVKVARGKYVLFRDADDLVSSNYIAAVLKVLRAHKSDNVVVGFQYCLCFWDCTGQFTLQELPNSATREENAKLLFGVNPWGSSLAGAKKIFLEHRFIATRDGFGHEDYTFNIELMADNILYRSAPDTVLFYRRKADSLIMQNSSKCVTQPYSKLFDYKEWKKYSEPSAFPEVQQAKSQQAELPLWRKVHRAILNSEVLSWLIWPLATIVRKVTGKENKDDAETTKGPEIPSKVLEAWKEQAEIEMQIFPTPHFQKYLMEYKLDEDAASYLCHEYWKLCQQITHTPDYIFIAPWIVAGGADKVLLNYIAALKQVHPKWKITVITTQAEQNTWGERLPKGVDLLEFGKITKSLDETCRDIVFTRLLVQLQCKKIHIINSLQGYLWVQNHLELAKSQFEIYVSLFADGQMTDGCGGWWGYGDPYLARIYPAVKKAFTENQNYIDRLIERNAFNLKKLLAIYQPIEITKTKHKAKPTEKDRKIRILWASRIVASKNPELVVRIAQKLDPAKYQLDVFGRFDENYQDFHFPEDIAALEYKGGFDGFNSLPVEEYDVLLYTSYSDGMPNIILEAAAAGLPIIASDVGGVGNFVKDHQTGILIDEIENEDRYLESLEYLRQNPEQLRNFTTAGRKLLKKQHSWEKFYKVVEREF